MKVHFKEIEEDFYKAYRSRMQDFMKLKNASDKSDVLIMHLGGIVVECYLKYLIVRKYGIKKYRYVKNTSYWFSDESVSLINKESNSTKDFIKNNSEARNPGHNLFDAIKSLNELNDIMTDDIDIMKKLQNIQNPLVKEETTYIDLRYRENEYFKNTNKFDDWMEDFNGVMKWLLDKSKIVEVLE